MQKRGQIFLIAAIIFVIAIYSVVVSYNTVKTYPTSQDYNRLSANYKTEYPKVINFATYNGTNITQAIDNFTITFLQQAKNTDPNFGLFYMFKDSAGNLHIVNTLNNKLLTLQYTGVDGNQVQLALLSKDTPIPGKLCIQGVSCVGANTFAGSIDSAYYETQITKLPDTLLISIPDLGVTKAPVDIYQFTSMTYTTTESLGYAGNKNVEVSVQQY